MRQEKERREIERILLVQPPAFTFQKKGDINPNVPLGIAYIASVLEKNGYQVRILDTFVEGWENEVYIDKERIRVGLSFKEIEERIREANPDLVGISNLFTVQRKNAHMICKVTKRINPDIITVMGGAHPTVAPETVLQDKNVDFVIIGEGERTIIGLLKSLEGERNLEELDGIGFRKNGRIIILPKTKFIEDLDSIPFPARHLLPMEKYFQANISHGGVLRKTPYASVVTSRGCPMQCTFCSAHRVWGKRYRYRSPENVIEEIKMLIQDYGIKELLFEDDNLTLNKRTAEEIFEKMIEEKFDLIWKTPNGVAIFTLDENLLQKMRKSGCYQLGFGVESGNQYVLDKIIKKPVDLNKAPRIIKYGRKLGIETQIFLVMGMPGETKEHIRDSFRFARKIKDFRPFISIANPYPGSELYDICKKNNYLVPEFSFDNLLIDRANIQTPDWTSNELKELIISEKWISQMHWLLRCPIAFLFAKIKSFLSNPRNFFIQLFQVIRYIVSRRLIKL